MRGDGEPLNRLGDRAKAGLKQGDGKPPCRLGDALKPLIVRILGSSLTKHQHHLDN